MSDQEEAPKVSMKLFIDKSTSKVVYAEADNNFVDFLFHALLLPVGAAMKNTGAFGSLENVYKSVEDLSPDLLNERGTKEALLNSTPSVVAPDSAPPVPLWMAPPIWPNPKQFLTCSNPTSKCHRNAKSDPKVWPVCDVEDDEARCGYCHGLLNCGLALSYVVPPVTSVDRAGGYVKERVPYMVTDDLVVKPLSTFAVVMLMNKVGVKDVDCIEERVVSLDSNQGMALLEASFKSKTVLSDTFLGKD